MSYVQGTISISELPPHRGLIVKLCFYEVADPNAPVPYDGEPPSEAGTDCRLVFDEMVLDEQFERTTFEHPFRVERQPGYYYLEARVTLFQTEGESLLVEEQRFFVIGEPVHVVAGSDSHFDLPLFWSTESPDVDVVEHNWSEEPNLDGAFDEASKFIFPQLGGRCPHRELPDDAVLLNIADQFDVHFVAYTTDENGDETEIVITEPRLKHWRIDLDTLSKAAGWNGGDLAIWDWPAVKDGVRLFQYPDANEDWISHIIEPGCLLEHTDVTNPPIVMIPNVHTVFMAGLPDREAQALMLELAVRATRQAPPITRRPLVIDENWKRWNLLPDDENPFAKEYERHFGTI